MQTFNVAAPHKTAAELSDGVAMAQALAMIAPEYFNPSWLAKIKPASSDNWRLKVSNIKKVLKGALDYHVEILGQQITDFKMPDVNEIAERHHPDQLGRLLQLILGCAVNCDRKQEYIEIIMGLETAVQHNVMNAIQELIMTEVQTSIAPDSLFEINDQLKRLTHELKLSNDAKEQITLRCHELDLQVAVLQEEKSTFVLENDRLIERLNHFESLEDPSTVAGRRFQQMQHKLELLQDEVFKLETARDEDKSKAELFHKEILEMQQKNEELQKESEKTRQLRDELDVLRHTSDKVELYETTIETYKKKLSDYNDVKRQIKVLEDKNSANVKLNLELDEELKKTGILRTQFDLFKKQSQELQTKLSEQIRRADKAEFESKRLGEKYETLLKEKQRLVEERDSMKDTIEELKDMQIYKESEEMQGNGSKRGSMSLKDGDVLDGASPEVKERMIRLQHENKMLKLKHTSSEDEQVKLLQSLLDDSKQRQNELETENRLANQRILELEGNISDLNENQSFVSKQEGNELRKQISLITRKLNETESELDRSKELHEKIVEQLQISEQKNTNFQEQLNRKEEEMIEVTERYKKGLEKAKQVMRAMESVPPPDILLLQNQLYEKDKLLANIERETQKELAVMDFENHMITTAFHAMGANMHRRAVDERLRQVSPTLAQTFLSRQRQATSKRLNTPSVTTSEFFDY